MPRRLWMVMFVVLAFVGGGCAHDPTTGAPVKIDQNQDHGGGGGGGY